MTEFEDSGIVQFYLKDGIGNLNYSTSCFDKNVESSMTVIAERGSIKIGGQYMEKVEYCHIKDYEMPELEKSNPANDYGRSSGGPGGSAGIAEEGDGPVESSSLKGPPAMETRFPITHTNAPL